MLGITSPVQSRITRDCPLSWCTLPLHRMFERYTESARRALFFARYDASALGDTAIETEHLLLGLTRDEGIVGRIFEEARLSAEKIREDIMDRPFTSVLEKLKRHIAR